VRPFRCGAAVLVAGLLFGTGCQSSASGPAKKGAAQSVARGQSNCPPDQAQNLTFSGGIVGNLTCQAQPTTCFWNPPAATKLIATIPLVINGKAATFSVNVGFKYGMPGGGPGTYEVPGGNTSGGTTQFVIQPADGSTLWVSRAGGRVTVLADDGSHVKGTIEAELDGPSLVAVTGSWGCVRATL
jgi:hypothetical protein